MKISVLRLLLCAVFAVGLSLSAQAQSQLGRIIAARVEGDVHKIAKDGADTRLKNNDTLAESDTVTTGKAASVVLIFENGSTVRVGAESKLGIDEFKVDPLAAPVDLATLKAEPTVSKTSLNLAYGELVGDVKHLNLDKGSSFDVKTPVGAAGIRGTIFRVVFHPGRNGKAFFTVTTADGTVLMKGVAKEDISIPKGKEVVVSFDVPDATPSTPTPAPTGSPTITPQDIPPATTAAINAATVILSQVLNVTTLPPSTTATATTTDKNPKKEDTGTPPPPVTVPAPQLTNPAGS